jgi:hypothetical protein
MLCAMVSATRRPSSVPIVEDPQPVAGSDADHRATVHHRCTETRQPALHPLERLAVRSAGADVPAQHHTAGVTGEEDVAVRPGEDDVRDRRRGLGERRAEGLSGGRLPQQHAPIVAGRSEDRPVRPPARSYGPNPAGVPQIWLIDLARYAISGSSNTRIICGRSSSDHALLAHPAAKTAKTEYWGFKHAKIR